MAGGGGNIFPVREHDTAALRADKSLGIKLAIPPF